MHVRIDEARQQRDVAEVDDFARSAGSAPPIALMRVAFDDDDRVARDVVRRAVEHARGFDGDRFLGECGGGEKRQEECKLSHGEKVST